MRRIKIINNFAQLQSNIKSRTALYGILFFPFISLVQAQNIFCKNMKVKK